MHILECVRTATSTLPKEKRIHWLISLTRGKIKVRAWFVTKHKTVKLKQKAIKVYVRDDLKFICEASIFSGTWWSISRSTLGGTCCARWVRTTWSSCGRCARCWRARAWRAPSTRTSPPASPVPSTELGPARPGRGLGSTSSDSERLNVKQWTWLWQQHLHLLESDINKTNLQVRWKILAVD